MFNLDAWFLGIKSLIKKGYDFISRLYLIGGYTFGLWLSLHNFEHHHLQWTSCQWNIQTSGYFFIIAWVHQMIKKIIHLVIKFPKYIVIIRSLIGCWSNSIRSFNLLWRTSIHSVFCALYSDIKILYQIVQMMKNFFPHLPNQQF